MKLNRRIILILIVLDILVVIIDMGLICFVKLFKNNENNKITEKTKELPDKHHYTCKGSHKEKNDKILNITYYIENVYEFSFDDSYKIYFSELKNTYIFDTDTDYNTFKENNQITYIKAQEYEIENRIIKYSFSGLYPNTTNEKQDYFTEEYLDLLEEKGFYCE